jgi:hypothetical protein
VCVEDSIISGFWLFARKNKIYFFFPDLPPSPITGGMDSIIHGFQRFGQAHKNKCKNIFEYLSLQKFSETKVLQNFWR